MGSDAPASSSARTRLRSEKPHTAQIEPVEVEQLERVIEQQALPACSEIGVQQIEIWRATRIRDGGFVIQDQVLRWQGRERIGDRLEAQRPVVACSGVDGRLSVLRVRPGAVAVELDLVDPAYA
jgi:hypothetical protein